MPNNPGKATFGPSLALSGIELCPGCSLLVSFLDSSRLRPSGPSLTSHANIESLAPSAVEEPYAATTSIGMYTCIYDGLRMACKPAADQHEML